MTDLSYGIGEAILNQFFRGHDPEVAVPRPTQYQVSAHQGDPGLDGAANEVSSSGTGYLRQPVIFGAPVNVNNRPRVASSVLVEFEQMPDTSADPVTDLFLWTFLGGVWVSLGLCEKLTPRAGVAGHTLRYTVGSIRFTM